MIFSVPAQPQDAGGFHVSMLTSRSNVDRQRCCTPFLTTEMAGCAAYFRVDDRVAQSLISYCHGH
jgi:hypothetical protein